MIVGADAQCRTTTPAPGPRGTQIDDELLAAFADQIVLEQASAQAYLQMAAWASAHDLTGTTAWLRDQAAEKTGHALRFLDYVLDRGAEIRLQALGASPADYDSVVAVFEAALVHESRVSRSIGELYAAAQAAGDYQSLPLLSWFLAEAGSDRAHHPRRAPLRPRRPHRPAPARTRTPQPRTPLTGPEIRERWGFPSQAAGLPSLTSSLIRPRPGTVVHVRRTRLSSGKTAVNRGRRALVALKIGRSAVRPAPDHPLTCRNTDL